MNQDTPDIPKEFDIIRTGKGYTMKGWDFTVAEIAEALQNNKMLNPTLELGSNICPLNCINCLSEDPNNPEGRKKRLANELPISVRIELIKQAHALGTRSINMVGAGEPTIDPHFWEIVELISGMGMTPIVYTEGSKKLTDTTFAMRLYELGSTIVLKANSLRDEEYQNRVVNSGPQPLNFNYFRKRNEALQLLLDIGFNRHDPTRLALDTIVCKENYDEITDLHRFARDNNIFMLFVNYVPAGRSSSPVQNALSREEQFYLFRTLAQIDKSVYGIEHRSIFPYAGGVPCSIRGLGLHVEIQGNVWDCIGKTELLGNIRQETLKDLWEKAAPVRKRFNGGCEPREIFWKQQDGKRHLPVLG